MITEVMPVEATDVPLHMTLIQLPPDHKRLVYHEPGDTSQFGETVTRDIRRYAKMIVISDAMYQDENLRRAVIHEAARRMYEDISEEFDYIISPLRVEHRTASEPMEQHPRTWHERLLIRWGLRQPRMKMITYHNIRLEVRVA